MLDIRPPILAHSFGLYFGAASISGFLASFISRDARQRSEARALDAGAAYFRAGTHAYFPSFRLHILPRDTSLSSASISYAGSRPRSRSTRTL